MSLRQTGLHFLQALSTAEGIASAQRVKQSIIAGFLAVLQAKDRRSLDAATQLLLSASDGVLTISRRSGQSIFAGGYNSVNLGYFLLLFLQLAGADAGPIGEESFAYLKRATRTNLAAFGYSAHI